MTIPEQTISQNPVEDTSAFFKSSLGYVDQVEVDMAVVIRKDATKGEHSHIL